MITLTKSCHFGIINKKDCGDVNVNVYVGLWCYILAVHNSFGSEEKCVYC